jgi:hypothetical protein
MNIMPFYLLTLIYCVIVVSSPCCEKSFSKSLLYIVIFALPVEEPVVCPPPTDIIALKSLDGCANLRLLVLMSFDDVLRKPD